MRMPELKVLAKDRRLKNYSRMRKAELVAFLTIWVKIIIRCARQSQGPLIKLARYLSLRWVNKILPIATFYLF